MKSSWIRSRVNSPKNEDAEIIVPVELNPCRSPKILRYCSEVASGGRVVWQFADVCSLVCFSIRMTLPIRVFCRDFS